MPKCESSAARGFYRIAWRNMAANTGERTLISALIPPGAVHVHTTSSVGLPGSERQLVQVASVAATLTSDFMIRAAPKGHIHESTLNRLPFVADDQIGPLLALRTLRLNCMTSAYSGLWSAAFDVRFNSDRWAGGFIYSGQTRLGEVAANWTDRTPLRLPVHRRQAILEIDALVALGLGLTSDELLTIYRTQFPVLRGYDRRTYLFDANGRQVPTNVLATWRIRDENAGTYSVDELTAMHPASGVDYRYELPFRVLDREQDLRHAYTEFERRFASRSAKTE